MGISVIRREFFSILGIRLLSRSKSDVMRDAACIARNLRRLFRKAGQQARPAGIPCSWFLVRHAEFIELQPLPADLRAIFGNFETQMSNMPGRLSTGTAMW